MLNELENSGNGLQLDLQPAAPCQENGSENGSVQAGSTEQPSASTAVPEHARPDASSQASAVLCARCQTPNSSNAETCQLCRSFLPANQVARKTGIYARQQPPDLKLKIEAFMSGVISDRGGESELSTLEHAYIEKLGDIDIMLRLITHDIANNGLLTPGGRVRSVYDKLLAGLAAFDRYAQRLGLERRPKRVQTLHEYVEQRAADRPEPPSEGQTSSQDCE